MHELSRELVIIQQIFEALDFLESITIKLYCNKFIKRITGRNLLKTYNLKKNHSTNSNSLQ